MKRINIELSAQELELAQKLAKASGFESIEEFVRFSLLRAESAGVDGANAEATASRNQMRRINGELTRLRNELRGFLSETSILGELGSVGSMPGHSPGQLQLSLGISNKGSSLQAGQPAPPSAEQTVPTQGIQLGYDRRAPGTKFNADELEDMANAAFGSSPQLGISAAPPVPEAEKAATNTAAQSEPDYPIEELIDDGPAPVASTMTASAALEFKPPPPSIYKSVNVESLFSGEFVSLADTLVASASNEESKSAGTAKGAQSVQFEAKPTSDPLESAPVRIVKVESEAKNVAGAKAKPENGAGTSTSEVQSNSESQNADSAGTSSDPVNPGQIKSPDISGNLPPRKRKS